MPEPGSRWWTVPEMIGILSNKIQKDELKPGDHIYSWRNAYLYAHHGRFPHFFAFYIYRNVLFLCFTLAEISFWFLFASTFCSLYKYVKFWIWLCFLFILHVLICLSNYDTLGKLKLGRNFFNLLESVKLG